MPDGQSIEVAASITLLPQTLNGIVSAVTNDGGFAVYTVTLAPYDLIPVLQNYTSNTPTPAFDEPYNDYGLRGHEHELSEFRHGRCWQLDSVQRCDL